MFSRAFWETLILAAAVFVAVSFTGSARADQGRVIKVLMTTGDWKAQPWYQDVWMAAGGAPKLYRGRYIQKRVEEVAPGRFEFTHIPNSIAQQYINADYLSQFDVLMIGDIMPHFSQRFQEGIRDFVQSGGGVIYCADPKTTSGTPMAGQLFDKLMPLAWPTQDFNGGKSGLSVSAALPDHPIAKGLDWASAPGLTYCFDMPARPGATVILTTTKDRPVLATWDVGKGRFICSAGIFSNDEESENFALHWKDFGKFYAQVFTYLAEHSHRQEAVLKDAPAAVNASADFTHAVNTISPGLFSIHGSSDIKGHAAETFGALNLKGAFARFDVNPAPKGKGQYDFGGIDHGVAEARSNGLEPLLLFSAFSYGSPKWLWADGHNYGNCTQEQADDIAEMVAATLQHTNHGRKGDADYQPNVKYIEICNEPRLAPGTLPGYIRIIKAGTARVPADFPQVKVGAYLPPYGTDNMHRFIDECGGDYDWLSFHPYGWSPDVLFQFLDEIDDYCKAQGHPTQLLITEWDFWIQGREKFDYMMTRNFQAVQHPDVIAAIHYRLWQYQEPIYMFGVLWEGWGPKAGHPGQRGDPMHDAYDAFWLFRDFRGQRVTSQVTVATPGVTPALADHLHLAASSGNGKCTAVLYYDWAYGGTGFKDYPKGLNYPTVTVNLKLKLTPSDKERTLTISKATGEGFETVKDHVQIPAGQNEADETIEVQPLTGYALTVE